MVPALTALLIVVAIGLVLLEGAVGGGALGLVAVGLLIVQLVARI